MGISLVETPLFDEGGRRILTKPYRVFDNECLRYYNISNIRWDFESIAERYNRFGGFEFKVDSVKIADSCSALRDVFSRNPQLSNLFKGVHVPFVVPKIEKGQDLSESLIGSFLPRLEASFRAEYPAAHFKAVMQGGAQLTNSLRVAQHSRYENFIRAAEVASVAGWYFPQALQQFDVASQILQMQELPNVEGLCLSGPAEIIYAVMGKPDLLINEDGYAPVLCMSALRHADDRLALVLKAYGPHLEFWCLSQMLAPGVTQVSEQWSGGVTLFSSLA